MLRLGRRAAVGVTTATLVSTVTFKSLATSLRYEQFEYNKESPVKEDGSRDLSVPAHRTWFPTSIHGSNTKAGPPPPPAHVKYLHLTFAPQEPTRFWQFANSAFITVIGATCKFFLKFLTDTRVYGYDEFLQIAMNKDRGRPLITVANHHSILDDPLLWGIMPFKSFVFPNQYMRTVLGAADICFTSRPIALFFTLGQSLPTIRGGGIKQPAIDHVIKDKADKNAWIHIYPESKVNQDGGLLPFKWGLGRICMETAMNRRKNGELYGEGPIVVPMYHEGMVNIMPEGVRFRPRPFQKLRIAFGSPVDLADIYKEYALGHSDEAQTRVKIMERVREAVQHVGRQLTLAEQGENVNWSSKKI